MSGALPTTPGLVAGAALLVGALTSAAEAALFNLPKQGLGAASKKRLRFLLSRPHRLSDVLRTLDLLADAAFFCALAWWLTEFGAETTTVDGLLVLGVAVLFLLGEVVPRALGCRFPVVTVRLAILPLELLYLCFLPLSLGASQLVSLLLYPLERAFGSATDAPDEEELRGVLGYSARRGDLGQEGVDMVEGILDLDEDRVTHVMTPRTKVVFVDDDATWEEAVRAFQDAPYRRLPMKRAGGEEVVAVLYVKDMLDAHLEGRTPAPREIGRKPLFLPGVAFLDDALSRLREAGYQMAVVVDEWGGTQGVLTMEDIVEEIVGEIRDEHDEREIHEEASAVRRRGQVFDLDGSLEIEELGDLLGLDLEDLPVETLGGLVFHEYGSLPEVGDDVEFRGYGFKVTRRDRYRIARVEVRRKAG